MNANDFFNFNPDMQFLQGLGLDYTMQITQIANGGSALSPADLPEAIRTYEERDDKRVLFGKISSELNGNAKADI